MAYFRYFNTIGYDVRGEKNNSRINVVTNILQRVRLKLKFIEKNVFFTQHFVIDGQTPESLAYEFYGDTELHWVIMYSQMITNPYYDWPLKYFDLQKYVAKKYTNINEIHHYEDSDGYEVDFDAPGAISITNSLYEEIRNDKLRNINVIKPQNVGFIVKEFKGLLK
tara:strand:+ start:731 stop:1228 length:498 start_codon:yes stop_codon:yes gene_type:complete